MLQQHSQVFVTLVFLADLAAVAVAWIASFFVRFELGLFVVQEEPPPTLAKYLPLLPLVLGAFALSFLWGKFYRPKRLLSFVAELGDIIKCSAVGWFLLVVATYFTLELYQQGGVVSRQMLFVFLVLSPLSLVVSHGIVRRGLWAARRRGWNQRHVAIVGAGRLAQRTFETIHRNAWAGMQVRYYVDENGGDEPAPGRTVGGVPVHGPMERLGDIIREHPVDAIFVALPMEMQGRLREVLDLVEHLTVDVRFVPDLLSIFTLNASINDFDGLPVLSIREAPIAGWNAVAKRVFDVALSIVCLVLAAVPMAIIAALVKLTSRGPVFFKQVRMGLNTRPFTMLKFRSMRVDSEADGTAVWATKGDPRRTPIGKVLRRLSFDELPQLVNVLKGDMSLVGPRPERPEFMEEFQAQIPTFVLRHKVKAGMTGWAQVNGLRGDTSLEKRIQYDLHYLNNWSIWFDVRILFLTVGEVIGGKNAY